MPTPSKRTALQSPNPVKHAMCDDVEPLQRDGNALLVSAIDLFDGNVLVDEASRTVSPAPSPEQRSKSDSSAGVQQQQPQSSLSPSSPSSNRDRFRNGFLPARTCCNLDLCRSAAGAKFTLTAVCIAVFPATTGPDRRYLQLADVTGTVGVTVWNSNVAKFSSASVGSLVTLNKCTITHHQGKKSLTLPRDATVEIVVDPHHSVFSWWQGLLQCAPMTCGGVHDAADNNMVSVAGVLGHVSSERKMVNGTEKELTTMHLVDTSGRLDIRSWNHSSDAFLKYVDRPVCIKRIRVTSFAGMKMAEFLDGSASSIETAFPGSALLQKFWSE
jgi:hypothetical protein